MTESLRLETWNGNEIRFVEKTGKWWAVAKDIAEALGYRDAEKATRHLPAKYKDIISSRCDTPKQGTTSTKYENPSLKSRARDTQEMIIINELGLYRLIMRSNKPEAETFQEWVYDVLKQLRQAENLEGFQVFRMLDKEHQKNAMERLRSNVPEVTKRHYMKANTIADKAVSLQYGLSSTLKKAAMTPDMLQARQALLDMAVDLIAFKERYNLDISVSNIVYQTVDTEKYTA